MTAQIQPDQKLSKKKIIMIATVEAFLILVVLIGSIVIITNNQKSTLSDQKMHQDDTTRLNSQISDLTSNLTKTNTKLTYAQTQAQTNVDNLDKLQSKFDTDETKIATQIATISDLQKERDTLNSQNTDLFNKNKSLSKIADCTNYPSLTNPDYTSNSSIATSLISWVGDQDGKTVSNTWNVVYNNSKTAIHKVTGQNYLWVFLVTFSSDPSGRGQNTVVFISGNACFLDRPG